MKNKYLLLAFTISLCIATFIIEGLNIVKNSTHDKAVAETKKEMSHYTHQRWNDTDDTAFDPKP